MVQLQAEIDSREMQKRLLALEDPLSSLHPDIRELSNVLYGLLRSSGNKIPVEPSLYGRYPRAFHILEAEGMIHPNHVLGRTFPAEVWVRNPSYILYMAALFEDADRMDALVALIDAASPKTWLRGTDLANQLGVPMPTIRAVFQMYEQRGLGLLSKEIGTANYCAIA